MKQRHLADLERMRAARRRLAQVRQRVRRLSWMARTPENLDAEVPLLTRTAWLQALARFQTIRLRRERAALLALRLDADHIRLRRAVAMHLIEHTRNCDTLGCADARTFLVLLKGADEAGAQAALERLRSEVRRLAAASEGRLVRLRAVCMPVPMAEDAAAMLHALLARLEEAPAMARPARAARPLTAGAH